LPLPSSNQPGRSGAKHPAPQARRAVPIRSCSRWGLPCRLPLPETRCALTAPFQFRAAEALSPQADRRDLLSVALSLGSPPPAVSRHRCFVEPGLSSTRLAPVAAARPSGPALLAGLSIGGKRGKDQSPVGLGSSSASRIARHSPQMMPSITSGRKRRWNARTAASGSLIS